ncbi:MAG TPA: DUF490 domain-containing protein, partial [Paracoccus sp. (in: a-proteobacteria)]|nr:DUF490 domain-containing protein [Paracoccus sp. (in: a-proteobacteria)]
DLTNQQKTAQAQGVFGKGVTDLSARADIRSLASFGRGWRGALVLDGRLADDGSGTRRLEVAGTGQDLALGQANLDGALKGETRLTLRGTERDGLFTIEQATIDNPAAQVSATGTIGDTGTDLRGSVDLRDLSALGLGWRGSFAAQGRFADDGTGARRLTLDGTANDLSLGQAQADAALAGPTRLTLRAVERDGILAIEEATIANARLNAAAQGAVGGGRTDLTARLNAASIAFLGRGIGGAVEATARVTDQDGARRITAEGTATGLRVGVAQVDPLLAGQTSFDLAAAQSADGAVTVDRLNVSNGQLRIAADGDPQRGLSVDASLSDLALLVPGFPGPAGVAGTIRQGDTTYAVELDATAPGGTRARIAGTAARDFSTVDLRISGVSDAALVNPMLRVRSIEGAVDFDLRLNGRPALENLSGRVNLPAAQLSDPKLGLRVENLNATADLAGGLIRIDATGQVADGGRLTVSGPVDLRGGTALDLRVVLDRVVLRDPNLYE